MQNEFAAIHFSRMHQTAGFEEKTTLLQGGRCIINAADIGNLIAPEEIPKGTPLRSSPSITGYDTNVQHKPGGQRATERLFLNHGTTHSCCAHKNGGDYSGKNRDKRVRGSPTRGEFIIHCIIVLTYSCKQRTHFDIVIDNGEEWPRGQ